MSSTRVHAQENDMANSPEMSLAERGNVCFVSSMLSLDGHDKGSFSDPGHASVAALPSNSILRASGLLRPQPPRTPSALRDIDDVLEDAERQDGPPSELHFSKVASCSSTSSVAPPVPPKYAAASLTPASVPTRGRSISIVTPDEQQPALYYGHRYSASEPGHSRASTDTRYYHDIEPRPFSIRQRRELPSIQPHSVIGHTTSASLESNMFRLHERSSNANMHSTNAEGPSTHVVSLSNVSAAHQQYYHQRLYRSSAALSVASKASARNKLRKAPPSGHGRSLSNEDQASGAIRGPRPVLNNDLSDLPPQPRTPARAQQRQMADSEMGYLSETERRMSVGDMGHVGQYPSFTSTARQSQLLSIPMSNTQTPNAPSRQPTVSSSESSGSGHYRYPDHSSERGRRPRQPTFRSSHTSHTTSTDNSLSSGGSASTAPTSIHTHDLSSSDWAVRLASDVLDSEKDIVKRPRTQSVPRKLVKKRYPQTPNMTQMDLPTYSPPPPLPHPLPVSIPNSPPPLASKSKERKRSKSILGLKLSFMRGKEKAPKRMSLDVEPDTRFEYQELPSVGLTEPLWLGSDHMPNLYASPSSYASPTSISMSTPSSPPLFLQSHPNSSPVPFSLSPLSFPSSPIALSLPPQRKHKTDPTPTTDNESSQRLTMSFRRISTHALESLAFTDPDALPSSAVAELTSRLSMVEGQVLGPEEWEKYRATSPEGSAPAFDPYDASKDEETQMVPPARPRPREKRHLYRDSALGETMRRWTLAMTDVSDDVLLDELERLRQTQGKDSLTYGSRPRVRSGRGRVGSLEGRDEEVDECRAATGHGQRKSKSMGGHEFVYGGPKRWGKFNFIKAEDEGADSCCSDCSDSSYEADEDHDGDHLVHELSPIIASPSSDTDWTTARRALLCCRDVIRTERSYLALLHQLTELVYPSPFLTMSTPMSHRTRTLIYTYLPVLIRASEAFLARLEDDPSAWGVSAAFIGCEEELEGAFIRWCGVVGEIFVEPASNPPSSAPADNTGPSGLRSRVGSSVSFGLRGRSKSGVAEKELESVYRPRAVSCYDGVLSPSQASNLPAPPLRPQTGLFTAALGTGLVLGLSPSRQHTSFSPLASTSHSHLDTRNITTVRTTVGNGNRSGSISRTFASWRRKSVLSQSVSSLPAYVNLAKEKQKGAKRAKGKRIMSVRELAIQPTQRVTRYVLQYRDLLQYTPSSSPSRALVERALESALRIAQKCDRAQGNSAFLRR